MQEFRLRKDYDIKKLLGTGGFGAVFLAKNLEDNKDYAVKLLGGSDDVHESSSEIDTFRRLPPHVNIVTYFSSWTENVSKLEMTQLVDEFHITSQKFQAISKTPDNASFPMICIQMELCEGDLRVWITDKSKNANMKIRGNIILQIAEGIQHLHDNNIIHRDLKPDNIFLNKEGSDYVVKIGDFGISKQHLGTRNAMHTANVGTFVYFAPEITGQKYGRKIDWYSLGLIIFEMFFPDMQPQPGDNKAPFEELGIHFTQLKYDRKLPHKLKLSYPKVAKLIVKLTEVNVDIRGDLMDVRDAFPSAAPTNEAPVKVPVPKPRVKVMISVPKPEMNDQQKPEENQQPIPEGKEKYILLKSEFAIKKLVGTGSYGAVFRVRSRSNKKYAIKLFAETSDLEECLKEVKNYEQIPPHRNVVAYHASWNEEMTAGELNNILGRFNINTERFKSLHNLGKQDHLELLCIQMELCSVDLRSWLSNNPTVDEDKCKNIFIQIAEGTQHLHNNHLIHRDLKPDNIFLKRDVIKIGDLGISKWHTSTISAEHTTNFGTIMYLAPEMQSSQYGKMVDWWASGLILFELFYPEMQSSNTSNPHQNVVKYFKELKFDRKLPEVVSSSWPSAADLILDLTESNPQKRAGYEEICEWFKGDKSSTKARESPSPPPPRHELMRGNSAMNSNNSMSSDPISGNIICGICRKDIVGVRYKCSICTGLNLCEKCEKKDKVHPKEHPVVKLGEGEVSKVFEEAMDVFAKGYTRPIAKVVFLNKAHVNTQCNQCGNYVDRDLSYMCLDCEEFNLCQKCHKKKKNKHDANHEFIFIYLKLDCKNCNTKCDRFSAYQCIKCSSFDLCNDCYAKHKKLHAEHRFVQFQEENQPQLKNSSEDIEDMHINKS